MDPKITVLIANAFPLVRNSMKDLLDSAPNVEVAGCAKTKDEVFALVDADRPRVSILDLEVEWSTLTDMVAKLAGRDTHALVMTDELDEDKTFQLLRAGANGIVSRRVDPELLCRSVKAVAGGEIWVPRTATSQLIQRFRMNPGGGSPFTGNPPVCPGAAADAGTRLRFDAAGMGYCARDWRRNVQQRHCCAAWN